MARLDLRLRIAIAFATVCIAVVGALGVTLYTAADDMEEALVDQLVSEEVNYFIEHYRSDPEYRPANGRNFAYHVVRSPEDEARLPREVVALAPGNHELLVGGDERHVAVREADGTRFVVIYDVGAHESREQQFKNVLLLSLVSVATFALLLGYWLAGLLTRQLRDLAQRVKRLGPAQAQAPLARPEQDAEVAALARALDDYQARMTRMIRHEQEFTANASHELRTPLTAVRTSCELLLADSGLPPGARLRVEMIDEAAQRMAEQLQTLLFIAREQGLDATEVVALRECAADAAEPFRGEMGRKGLVLHLDIDPAEVLPVNRQALHTVLANLIRNAVQHTERGAIRVRYEARRLSIADSGSGIAPEHLSHIFERYYRAREHDAGMGLGLAIVKRICDHYGWRLEVSSTPGHGSEFSLLFP
ncbi:MAG TPA: HAMP domain-containing sensor histidine kinase [Burkholderiales bacterium]|nr:HAMP domain-containing sensor histidine kinase [Burkholderiales bacterium]